MENVSQWTSNPKFDDAEVQRVISYMTGKIAKQDRIIEDLSNRLAIQREHSGELAQKNHELYMQIDRIHTKLAMCMNDLRTSPI